MAGRTCADPRTSSQRTSSQRSSLTGGELQKGFPVHRTTLRIRKEISHRNPVRVDALEQPTDQKLGLSQVECAIGNRAQLADLA